MTLFTLTWKESFQHLHKIHLNLRNHWEAPFLLQIDQKLLGCLPLSFVLPLLLCLQNLFAMLRWGNGLWTEFAVLPDAGILNKPTVLPINRVSWFLEVVSSTWTLVTTVQQLYQSWDHLPVYLIYSYLQNKLMESPLYLRHWDLSSFSHIICYIPVLGSLSEKSFRWPLGPQTWHILSNVKAIFSWPKEERLAVG